MATSTEIDINDRNDKKEKAKKSINFYLSHLDLNELEIIQELSYQLARRYSRSYLDWFNDKNKF